MHQSHEPDKPLARIEDGYLILNDGAMWDYEIHLSEKRWFSADMKAQMLGALMQGAA